MFSKHATHAGVLKFMADKQWKVGQSVNCSEAPDREFTIVDVIGSDDVTQYNLKDSDG